MTAKMPMSGSSEKRRDCIAQLPLRSAIFTLAMGLDSANVCCAFTLSGTQIPTVARGLEETGAGQTDLANVRWSRCSELRVVKLKPHGLSLVPSHLILRERRVEVGKKV